jgi:hypothetical protein
MASCWEQIIHGTPLGKAAETRVGYWSRESRPASPELLTREPYLLPTWIRIHPVFEPISETNAWIATESGIEWPQRATYLICKG